MLSTCLLTAGGVLAWGTIVVLMFMPVKHLYDRGHGRLSAVACLLMFPLIMAILSIVVPLCLDRLDKRLYAVLAAAGSLLLWIAYCYYLAVRMVI